MEQKSKEKTEFKTGLRAIGRHTKVHRNQLILLSFLGIISAAANGFVPYVTGRFLDALIGVSQGQSAYYNLFPLWAVFLGIWAFVQLVANNIDWVMDRLRRQVDNKVHFGIQVSGFLHLLRLPISYHKSGHINGILEKIGQMGWRVSAIVRTIVNVAPQFLSIVIGIVLAASINFLMALILLAGVVFYSILLVKMLIPIAEKDSEAHRLWNKGWNDAAEAVHQVESVKQATAEEHESKKIYTAMMEKTLKAWGLLERHWSNVSFYQRMTVFITQLTVFIVAVKLVAGGAITIGELVALNGYAAMFFGPFVQLGHSWQVIQNGITTAAQAEETFSASEEKYEPEGGVDLPENLGEISFKKVYFSYGKRQPLVLNGISFSVKPGEAVALVGESGVGKSTTISLISGYNFPSRGSVLINGLDTKKINLTSLRQKIAVVPQEIALFNDTIKENIRYGSFFATDKDIVEVSKKVHLAEFISGLPEKYDTLVGERGVKLSVGQKQRVAIARAMLRNPSILILDEPTSALDAQTEKTITASLEELMRGRTTLIIAHRLSTVRKADTILVFEKGKIVESGSHDELVKNKNGVYRRLYEYQIGLH